MKNITAIGIMLVAISGCQMTEQQQQALMGTLVGATAGSLVGNDGDRKRNTLIGAGVGAIGTMMMNQGTARSSSRTRYGTPYRRYHPEYNSRSYEGRNSRHYRHGYNRRSYGDRDSRHYHSSGRLRREIDKLRLENALLRHELEDQE